LQFLAHLAELRGDRLHQMIELRVYGLSLRRQGILHFLTHRGKLRVRTTRRRPHNRRDNANGNQAEDQPHDGAHE
jgi:hypothetical protein